MANQYISIYIINIYHKGCGGTMVVPVFASENIELTFAFKTFKISYQPCEKYREVIQITCDYVIKSTVLE